MNSDISQTLNGSLLFWNICIFPSKPMECLNRLLTFSLKCFLLVCFSSLDLKNIGSGKPVRLLKMPPKVHIQMWNARNEVILLWIIKYICIYTTRCIYFATSAIQTLAGNSNMTSEISESCIYFSLVYLYNQENHVYNNPKSFLVYYRRLDLKVWIFFSVSCLFSFAFIFYFLNLIALKNIFSDFS